MIIDGKAIATQIQKEIGEAGVAKILKNLSLRALKENVTFLCIEEKPDFCHRRLLAEECKKYQPNLEIIIN